MIFINWRKIFRFWCIFCIDLNKYCNYYCDNCRENKYVVLLMIFIENIYINFDKWWYKYFINVM